MNYKKLNFHKELFPPKDIQDFSKFAHLLLGKCVYCGFFFKCLN